MAGLKAIKSGKEHPSASGNSLKEHGSNCKKAQGEFGKKGQNR
jgi:hypothetical protein